MNETETNTIAVLCNYRKKFMQAKRYNEHINDLRAKLYGLHITDYSKDRVNGAGGGDLRESIIDRLTKIEHEYAELILGAQSDMREIEQRIDKLDYPYNEVLVRRYCKFDKFEQIALDLNREYRWIRRLHKTALGMFAKLTL